MLALGCMLTWRCGKIGYAPTIRYVSVVTVAI
jgi:hypothetical protein